MEKAKRVVEVCYSNSMKINRGAYEQEAPFYSAKTIIEENGTPVDEVAEYGRLRSIIDPLLTAQYQEAKLDMSGLRIRIKDGKKFVSVSSILHPDGIPKNIDPDYAVRGTEIHRIFNRWILEGVWDSPAVPLSKLTYESIPYQEFTVKFKDRFSVKDAILNLEVYNLKHLYSGELDALLTVDGLLSLVDFKTGSWSWEQLVAYYKALANKEVKQLVIFDLKNLNLEVMALNDPKCVQYWESFLIKRGVIQGRFGV